MQELMLYLWVEKIQKIQLVCLTNFLILLRKALSKKIDMKFLPKVSFVGDKSFDYAEKIEKLIQKNK